MTVERINVTSGSTDWRAHILSNFPCIPFKIGNEFCASAEGFIQGIKFPEDDARRKEAFLSWGKRAKEYGTFAERKRIWWDGRSDPYGSDQHRMLIAIAINAKFAQNDMARKALHATTGLELYHDVGPESPDTSLPAELFCRILMEIRDKLPPLR